MSNKNFDTEGLLSLAQELDASFMRMVIKLFATKRIEIPSLIDHYYSISPVLKGEAFYSRLIHTVPLHEVGCSFHSDRRDAIWEYCKIKIEELRKPVSIHEKEEGINVIFKPEYKGLFQALLEDAEVWDPLKNRPTLKFGDKKAFLVRAIIKAIHSKRAKVLSRDFSTDQLLEYFNTEYGTKYGRYRNGKETGLKYRESLEAANLAIARYNK